MGFFVVLGLCSQASLAKAAPVVAIVHAGSGPTAPLRLGMAAGQSQSMDVVWAMSMTMNMDGLAVPMDVPPVKIQLEATASEETDGDKIVYLSRVKSLGLQAAGGAPSNPMLASMEAEMKKLAGVVTQVVISRSGAPISTEWTELGEASESMVRELTSAMNQALVVFPATAVGVGAKWTVTEDVVERGVKLKRKTVLELTERDGSKVWLSLTMSADLLSPEVHSPELPAGSTATMTAFEMNGSGTVVMDLAQLFPLKSDVSVGVKTSMAVSAAGQTMSMGNEMKFSVTLRSE